MADTVTITSEDVALLDKLIAELGAALIQTVPSDDQIIIEHMREAHRIGLELRAYLNGRATA